MYNLCIYKGDDNMKKRINLAFEEETLNIIDEVAKQYQTTRTGAMLVMINEFQRQKDMIETMMKITPLLQQALVNGEKLNKE